MAVQLWHAAYAYTGTISGWYEYICKYVNQRLHWTLRSKWCSKQGKARSLSPHCVLFTVRKIEPAPYSPPPKPPTPVPVNVKDKGVEAKGGKKGDKGKEKEPEKPPPAEPLIVVCRCCLSFYDCHLERH